MIPHLLDISPETDSLIGSIALCAFSLLLLSRALWISWSSRGDRDRSEAAMTDRVLAVLDTYEAEDPEFVAEVRDLHGFLTPNAWITRVRTRAGQSNLSPQARADLMATSANFQVGAS